MENPLIDFYKKIRLKPDTDTFTIFFVLVLVSLGFGVYNNYLLRTGGVVSANNPGVQNVLPVKDLVKKVPANSPRLGNPKAKVVVVAFEDFKCPFCKRFHDVTYPQLKRDYIDTGKILFIHQDLAFLSVESNMAAEAAQCANDQNKFWEYKDSLYASTVPFTENSLKDIAINLGLNTAEFNQCLDSQKHKDLVAKSKEFATSYGISSTPTFVINGNVVRGAQPIAEFERIINSEL